MITPEILSRPDSCGITTICAILFFVPIAYWRWAVTTCGWLQSRRIVPARVGAAGDNVGWLG